jgi:hypothetical protein
MFAGAVPLLERAGMARLWHRREGAFDMPDESPSTSVEAAGTNDPIIRKVAEYHSAWRNTGYRRRPPIDVGKGRIHIVGFYGQDKQYRENYVYESRGNLDPYETMWDLLRAKGSDLK